MPLSQRDLALYRQTSAFYDVAKKLASAVDVRLIQRVRTALYGPDVRLPGLEHDDGRPVTVARRTYQRVMIVALHDLAENGWESAVHVAGLGLLGNDYTDDLLPVIKSMIKGELVKRDGARSDDTGLPKENPQRC